MRKVSSAFGTGLNGTLVKTAIKQHGMGRHCIALLVLTETGCAPRRLSTQTEYTDIKHFSIPTSSSISLTAGESENNGAKHNTMGRVLAMTLEHHQFILWILHFLPEGVLIVTAPKHYRDTQIKISTAPTVQEPQHHITIHCYILTLHILLHTTETETEHMHCTCVG